MKPKHPHTGAADARVVVQMTPKEKRALEARARRVGLSISEFVRRRLTREDLTDHREEIDALLATLEASAPRILKSVERTRATASKLSAKLDVLQS